MKIIKVFTILAVVASILSSCGASSPEAIAGKVCKAALNGDVETMIKHATKRQVPKLEEAKVFFEANKAEMQKENKKNSSLKLIKIEYDDDNTAVAKFERTIKDEDGDESCEIDVLLIKEDGSRKVEHVIL
ncbi:MAG: DUF4878 domain-containing protein [Prevotellaceae bacterium]|jgi:hypothetical protein|nr:DUF4878 domain-containing protein [Prevotellaceae bacterium]